MSDTTKQVAVYAAAAVASFYFPAYAPIFFAGAGMVSAYLNKPDGVEGSRLDDTAYSKSAYGIPIPRGYGTFPVAGIYVWAPPLSEHKDTQTEHGVKQVTYTYSASFACLLCEGPITAVRRIWFDTQLVYDISPENTESVVIDGLDITIYTGTADQSIDPIIESYEGAGEVPAWRGFCYFVVNNLPLSKFGNRRPNVRAEIVKNVTPTTSYVYETDIPWTPMLSTNYCEVADQLFMWNSVSQDSRIWRFDPVTMDVLSVSGAWVAKPPYQVDIYEEDLMTPDPRNCVIVSSQMPTLNQMWPCWRAPITGAKVLDWPAGEWYIVYADQTRGACRRVIYMEYYDEVGEPEYITRWYYLAVTSIGSGCVLRWQGWLPDRLYCSTDPKNIIRGMDGVEIVIPYITAFNAWGEGVVWCDGVQYNLITEMDLTTYITFGTDSEIEKVFFHIPTNSWVMQTDLARMFRFTIDTSSGHPYTFTLEAYSTNNGNGIVGEPITNGRQFYRESEIWCRRTGHFEKLRIEDLVVVEDYLETLHGPTGGGFWHEGTQSILTGGDAYETWRWSPGRSSNGADLLKDVVADLCDVAGMSTSEYDVSALTGEVRGFPITQNEQIRTTLTRLMTAHKFGCLETDGKVTFVHFPGSLGDTIPETDLAAHDYGSTTPDQMVITRERELTFPRRVDVAYLSYPREYESDVQGASRQITPSTKISKVEVVEVLSDDEARQLADVMLQAPLNERNEFEFQLSNKYLYLNPYDEILLTKGAATYRVRIIQMDYGTPGLIRCVATSTNPASFSSSIPGAPSNFLSSVVANVRDSMAWLIDAPIMSYVQDENEPSFLWLATSDSTYWSGANLHQLSSPYIDTGVSPNIVSATNIEGNAGICATVLGDHERFTVWDDVNTLNVYMWNGTLSSATDTELFAGSNTAIVGNEVIQFGTVTAETDGSYTLSHFLRGRRGTENLIGTHTDGESLVILDETTWFEVLSAWAIYQQEWYYKAITFGFKDRINGQAFTTYFRKLMPFAPALLDFSFNGTDITISWDRRTRSLFEEDYQFVPESEESEEYEVVIGYGYGDFNTDSNQYDGTDLWEYTGLTEATITIPTSDLLTYRNDFGVQIFKISQDVRDNTDDDGRGYPLLLDFNEQNAHLPIVEDMSRYAAGTLLTDNFVEVDADYDVWGVQTYSGAVADKVLSIPCTLNEDYWLALASSKDSSTGKAFTNYEVLVRQFDLQLGGSSELYENGVAIRMHGTYLDRTCYAATIDKDGNGRLWHVSSSGATWTQLGSTVTLGFSDGDTLYTRIRDMDGTISVKWWVNASSEPASWDLSVEDSTIDPANCLYAAGVALRRVSVLTGDHDYLYDYFSLAFDGNTAPTPT